MPDYRHHAPTVVLFTDDEHLVLCDWFGVDYPRSERWIDDILDEWNIPYEIPEHRRIDAVVAQILLERVQDDHPNWTAGVGDRFVVARPILDRRARRKVELWPRHLMTINWADSGPGFSWPVAYKATYVPGFSRTVVTASADCSESFGGVCDVAIGCFGPDVSFLHGSHDVIVSDWSSQRDHNQPRWAYLFDTGSLSLFDHLRARRRPARMVAASRFLPCGQHWINGPYRRNLRTLPSVMQHVPDNITSHDIDDDRADCPKRSAYFMGSCRKHYKEMGETGEHTGQHCLA